MIGDGFDSEDLDHNDVGMYPADGGVLPPGGPGDDYLQC